MRNLLLVSVLVSGLICFAQSVRDYQVNVDLFWMAATQQPDGWRVTKAYRGTRTLRVGDLLLKIDDQDLSTLGPLAVIAMLDDVPFRHVPMTIERDGQTQEVSVFGEGVQTDGTVKANPSYLKDILQRRDQPAPPFSLKNLENQNLSLSQYRGRWVLLNVWGTWCSGCMQELPALEYLSSHYHDRVAVVGIAVNDNRSTLTQFVAERQLSYPVLIGGTFDDAFAHSYGIHVAPTNILIAPDGTVRFAGIGPHSLKSAVEMLAQFERLRTESSR